MDLPALAHRRGLRALVRPGPHDAEILRLAIPAFGALVAEPLFLLGDSATSAPNAGIASRRISASCGPGRAKARSPRR